MTVSKAIQYALEYHRNNSKKNTLRSCELVLTKFESQFKDRELVSITPDEVLSFLTALTDGRKQSTKRSRYAALSAFFSLIQNALDPQLRNPCKTSMLKKLFRPAKAPNWKILEKETVDEVIFRTPKPRNRIILELMARGGMRIGEVLGLRAKDSGTPIEIVSKVILRHANLSTTQRYLGKVSDVEALR